MQYRSKWAIRLLVVCSFGLSSSLHISKVYAQPKPASGLDAALALQDTFVRTIAKGEKSVVAIARARKGEDAARLVDPRFVPNEFATGVVVDRRGLILTNAHVLGDPGKNDYAVWIDRRPYRAKVKATDPWSDLAILEINAKNLTPVVFGKTKQLKKGQIVIALGNPFGIAKDGKVSASWGIISNLSRKASPNPQAAEKKPTMHHYGTLIQTDVKLHLGTSGGALLNLKGEMIGLTTSLAARSGCETAVGYAIPVDEAFRHAVKALKEGREVEHGFLGVAPGVGQDALAYRERSRGKFGVVVNRVVAGTPASRTCLRMDDLITHIDGMPIHDADQLILYVGQLPVGHKARLRVERGRGDSLSVMHPVAILSKREPVTDWPAVVTVRPTGWKGLRIDYVTAVPGFQTGNYLGEIDPKGCVAVIQVERDSAGFQVGIRSGMFITHINGKRVTTPQQFYTAVRKSRGSASVRFSSRPGKFETRTIE